MIVESMTNEELRKAVEADLEKVRVKSTHHLHSIEKVMRKTKMTRFKKYFPYFSPNKNHWIYGIVVTPKHTTMYYCVYYYTSKGITVLQPISTGCMYKFNGHVFERYFERQQRNVNVPQQWIMQYMDETIGYCSKLLDEIAPGIFNVFITVPRGACLGTYNKKLNFHEVRTFITPEIMFPEQLAIYNETIKQIPDLLKKID